MDYVTKVIDPYVIKKRTEHQCPDSHVLLLFDCWSVHRSYEWISWLKLNHPDYHVVFIPAGCSSKGQPADLMLQRLLKHEFANHYTDWVSSQILSLVHNGAAADQIRLDTGLTGLKPLLVEWLMLSWNKLRAMKEMITKGWEKAGLDKMMQSATQEEAFLALGSGRLTLNDDSNGLEAEPTSAADVDDIMCEMDLDEGDHPEDDEEEIDAEVCLQRCV